MLLYIFAAVSLFAAGTYGQMFGPSFPFGMMGFDPTRFAANMQAQMQGLSLGLQNMGANIQSTVQRTVADGIRRAQASGNYIDTSDLRPGEYRRYTDRNGNTIGFAYRSADGQSAGFSYGGGQGSGFFFSNGPNGQQQIFNF